jgi:hypothetical protein
VCQLSANKDTISTGYATLKVDGLLRNMDIETFRFSIGTQSWKAHNVEYVSPLVYKFSTPVTVYLPRLTGEHSVDLTADFLETPIRLRVQ